MTQLGIFPFGEPVRKVVQEDRTLKRAFILGVYASAVHARWIGPDNKKLVNALAVASEPYIFWRGENAASIIQQITVPIELGRLDVAERKYNGPSGNAFDNSFLEPLGFTRADVWLCDLVPHSCMNTGQDKAIERAYLPIARKYGLPIPTVPIVPNEFTDETRRKEILEEIRESGANMLILLGDKPIRWFLSYFDYRWNKLSDFGRDNQSYGGLHTVKIDDISLEILPLAHPRQVAKLGKSSSLWYQLHKSWASGKANKLLN